MLKQMMIAAMAVTFCTAPVMAKDLKPKTMAYTCECDSEDEDTSCPTPGPCSFEEQEEELITPEVRRKKCRKCPKNHPPKAKKWYCSDDEVVLEEEALFITVSDKKKTQEDLKPECHGGSLNPTLL